MDFEQVRHKASVVCLNSGRCTEGHFVGVTKMVPHNKPPDKKTECEMCRCETRFFPFAFPPAQPYNGIVGSEAIVLCEMRNG